MKCKDCGLCQVHCKCPCSQCELDRPDIEEEEIIENEPLIPDVGVEPEEQDNHGETIYCD